MEREDKNNLFGNENQKLWTKDFAKWLLGIATVAIIYVGGAIFVEIVAPKNK